MNGSNNYWFAVVFRKEFEQIFIIIIFSLDKPLSVQNNGDLPSPI